MDVTLLYGYVMLFCVLACPSVAMSGSTMPGMTSSLGEEGVFSRPLTTVNVVCHMTCVCVSGFRMMEMFGLVQHLYGSVAGVSMEPGTFNSFPSFHLHNDAMLAQPTR